MFDIAWSELLLIAVVALIFIGPKELPHVLHTLGRMVTKIRRSADDFRRQFEDSVREAGYEDLHKNIQQFRSLHPASQLKDSIARAITDYTPNPATPDAPTQQPLAEHKRAEDAAQQSAPSGTKPPLEAPADKRNGAALEKPGADAASQTLHAPATAQANPDRVAPAA